MNTEQAWLVCDEGICLYSERAAARLKSDPWRCICHGAILFTRSELNGMDRRGARKSLDEQDRG